MSDDKKQRTGNEVTKGQLKPDEQEQEERKKQEQERQEKLLRRLSLVVAGLGLLYLVSVPFRTPDAPKLGTPEAIIFAAILVAASGLLEKLNRLSISGSGIELQVKEVGKRVDQQQKEIEKLQWLLSYFATPTQLALLRLLAQPGRSAYPQKTKEDLELMHRDLRQLCNRAMIRRQEGRKIANVPAEGDLKEWVVLLLRGKQYLLLRDEE